MSEALELSDDGWIDVVAAVGFDESNEMWPVLVRALAVAGPHFVVNELERIAYDLERRSDNVPMSRDGRGVEKVGSLREIAERIRARIAALRTGGES